MNPLKNIAAGSAFTLLSACACAADFSGQWTVDLRSPQERQANEDCGAAYFTLKQTGDKIVGAHVFYTARCGRMNEGEDESVKGIVIGNTAVLVVTSARNGGMVLGKATRHGNQLLWTVVDELKSGEPQGDELILGDAILLLDSSLRKPLRK
ncbi:hypothetical protein AAKU55_002447 [Oxalobacteraceae bacterium GrIS 1.11]